MHLPGKAWKRPGNLGSGAAGGHLPGEILHSSSSGPVSFKAGANAVLQTPRRGRVEIESGARVRRRTWKDAKS